jgi:hypothetical protein
VFKTDCGGSDRDTTAATGDGRERRNTDGDRSGVATVTAVGAGRGQKVRPQTVACSWCRQEVDVPAKGRVPKWCGTSCRHRAWEQHRAAASGRSAVDVVERVVERIVTVQLPAPAASSRPSAPPTPTGSAWSPLLAELARQLDSGRIYTRDLAAITPAFSDALNALNRRLTHGPIRVVPVLLSSGEVVEPPPDGGHSETDRAFRGR